MSALKEFLLSVKWLFKDVFFKGWLSLFTFVVLGFLQSISILLLIPLLSVSDTSGTLVKNDNYFIQKARFFLGYFNIPLEFGILLFIFALIIILYSFLKYYNNILTNEIGQGVENKLRKELHHSYVEMEWVNIAKLKSSDVLGTITREVSQLSSFISRFIQFLGTIIMVVFQLAVAFLISPQITLIVMATAIAMVLLQRKMLLKSVYNGRNSIRYSEVFHNSLVEHLMNIKLSKSQGLDTNQKKTLERYSDDIYVNKVQFTKNRSLLGLIYDVGTAVAVCLFLYIGFVILSIPIANLILLVIVFSRILPGVKSGIEKIQFLLNMAAGINQVHSKITGFKKDKETDNETRSLPIEVKDEIVLDRVSFGYTTNNNILSDVSLTIKKQGLIAITGESGSGKTTLMDVLTGLLKPVSGSITIDGKNLQEAGYNNWRRSIAYMTQEHLLFHDTIRNNMLWSNPDASEQDIWDALKKANAKEYVLQLQSGIDTIVGDRGNLLSGGQRQRIALAMTLVRKPALLILDEATNALDEGNENEILEEIMKLKQSMIIIIITHRISTLKLADQAFVLKNGRLTGFSA